MSGGPIDNVTEFPLRAKPHDKTIALAPDRWSGCPHLRAFVDEKLAELLCSDCGAKLNAIQFLVGLANQSNLWDREHDAILKARAALEERKLCRCKRCGEMTEIDRVHRSAVPGIRKRRQQQSAGLPPKQQEIV